MLDDTLDGNTATVLWRLHDDVVAARLGDGNSA